MAVQIPPSLLIREKFEKLRFTEYVVNILQFFRMFHFQKLIFLTIPTLYVIHKQINCWAACMRYLKASSLNNNT